jgi:uncharacterized damage-inducible protein DinB
MNYYGAKDLAAAFRTVRKNTITIAQEVGEEYYGFRPAPGSRSVGETLVHIAISPRIAYQMHATDKLADLSGFDFMGIIGARMALEKKPHTKAETLALLNDDTFAAWMDTLSDEFLAEVVTMHPMVGGKKTRFEMLLGAKEHEMHHRAQLMVMERLLGITPHFTRQMEARIAEMQAAKA